MQDDVSRSEIATVGVFERITAGTPLGSSSLNPQKYPFLQSRLGREGGNDLFDLDIASGMTDFWSRFQIPFATAAETVHLDEQVIKGTVEELMSFNGWAAAACTTLTRPFAARTEDSYSDLSKPGRLFFFALVVHSADHFFIDQLAAIVQVSRKLGTQNIFVSILDYASSDSTPFLSDLAEAVLILLGVPFRIRRVPPMTEDPAASYYPLEEAVTRNLALEPLYELYERRKVVFSRVIWLKGFTCPNDLLETLRVSFINAAAMVCSMDWKEHNGFFIYNDRCVLVLLAGLGARLTSTTGGELVISTGIFSAGLNRRPRSKRLLPDIAPRQTATTSTFHSKSSAASPARMSSTHTRPTTRASGTGLLSKGSTI